MHPKPDDPGRELYIIPLKKDEPIPEYIELLDNLQLPMDRPGNLIIGMFVLSKGKLKDDPDPIVPSPVVVQPNVPIPPIVGSTPTASQPPISSLLANLPQMPGVDRTALAAEVASLTPDQISLMLRSLSQTVPATAVVPVPVPVPPPAVPTMGASPIPGYPTPLAMPPFAPNLPHLGPQHSPQAHSHTQSPQSRMGVRNGYDEQRRPHETDEGGRRGRGRGHRPPRPQGRGRPHNDDRELLNRERDNGWRGRGRG